MQRTTVSTRSTTISIDDIIALLRIGTQSQYNARDLHTTNATIELHVTSLFGQDYDYQLISNTNGELSLYYPRRILVPIIDKWSNISTPKIQSTIDIREFFVRSRIARCRSRFVVPVILLDGKYICRSSTVASWGEVYSRSGVDRLLDTGNRTTNPSIIDSTTNPTAVANDLDGPPTIAIVGAAAVAASASSSSNVDVPQQNIFDKLRGADIDLLKMLDVSSIVNLMVEKRKTMFGVNVTSSENSDKENRYRDFQLLILPYPGCEHFRDFSFRKYNGELMFYDWSLPLNDSSFQVPEHLSSRVQTDWSVWKSWSSIDLTKNYFQLILRHLETNDHGLLIHCISGWDRTPLFISLLRLSLWADGWIHQSLTVEEMLYLTLAYDWYLFGHCLPERLLRGEEILYFAFMMLPHLVSDEFVYKQSNNSSNSQLTTVSNQTDSIYSISGLSDFENLSASNSLSSVTINDNSTINFNHNTDQLSFNQNIDLNSSETNENGDSIPSTIRKEKLFAVFHLFQLCYRTVIPNRPPTTNSSTNLLPDSLSSFNPRPIGREIARSINNFIGQWRTQPR
ncbi:unnamed protein product [Rotaria sp. Silwood2]|nr:unnamed protein product [Rotaria sp. Silwood2]CAF2509462.1 unnamed protein product [Rotaria sp. Silwood2]CAF2882440.1 unnamed protein product [Rotaria sp. Silwood2]CAF4234135.1 unnamed protein product [Rotaria sp. Silwood2]CAF4373085.1 unnamed protein product [Rotaria sp. Silwood2]